MGIFNFLNNFFKKKEEGGLEDKIIIISQSLNPVDKASPYCIRKQFEAKNHSFENLKKLSNYIIINFPDFKIKYERMSQQDIEYINATIIAYKSKQ